MRSWKMSTYRLTTHGTNTDLLDLPYGQPLAEWDESLIVHVPRGISRHIVRFVEADGEIFALKEATDRFVLREHSLLRLLADRSVPVVDAYGTVVERTADDGGELPGLLLTKHLTFSLPYRSLFTGRGLPALSDRLLDALAELFVRLHLAGFYWGDCSLSNTLFRRDAGALAAYLVDAETAELAILEEYLPKGLSDAELEAALAAVIAEKGLTSQKDVGLAMKELMARHKGRVDGKKAQETARRLLP